MFSISFSLLCFIFSKSLTSKFIRNLFIFVSSIGFWKQQWMLVLQTNLICELWLESIKINFCFWELLPNTVIFCYCYIWYFSNSCFSRLYSSAVFIFHDNIYLPYYSVCSVLQVSFKILLKWLWFPIIYRHHWSFLCLCIR